MKDLYLSWNLWRDELQEKPTSYPQFRERIKERFTVAHANFGMKAVGLFLTDIERAKVLKAKQDKEHQPRRYQNGEARDPAW